MRGLIILEKIELQSSAAVVAGALRLIMLITVSYMIGLIYKLSNQ